jgi:peptidyl-prolyl cis-trans isomerase SurA
MSMKNWVTALCLLICGTTFSQTLFTYGNDSVSAKEFLRAWHKNNTGPKTEQAFTDYLDLYIASRLKIREAMARGYDTLPQLTSDLDNLRQQILPSYLTDKAAMQQMVNEAFDRSQKDIHIAHIFISLAPNGTYDTAAAQKKLAQAEQLLKGNADFATVAAKYSDDPSAAANGGDIGYITVFSLPYELENLAYNTAPGKVSKTYRSVAGYHIFRQMRMPQQRQR